MGGRYAPWPADGLVLAPPRYDAGRGQEMDRQTHWDTVYGTRSTDAVGWYEADPRVSRRLVERVVRAGARSVIDIGAGASSLVDHLLDLELDRIGALDLAPAALAVARQRLGPR